jgi:hypothetical protein
MRSWLLLAPSILVCATKPFDLGSKKMIVFIACPFDRRWSNHVASKKTARPKRRNDPDANGPFIAERLIETRKVELRPGVRFRIKVTRVSHTLDFSLLIWDPKAGQHEEYAVLSVIQLECVYPDQLEAVGAFLEEEWAEDKHYDPGQFSEQGLAERIMEGMQLLVENGGVELNIYFRYPGLEDMISIPRDEAEAYVRFTTR